MATSGEEPAHIHLFSSDSGYHLFLSISALTHCALTIESARFSRETSMSFHTRLCTFKTDDNERLHGLLFASQTQHTDLALLFVHGVAMNFYLPPLSVFGQELAARGFHSLVINTRGHDWISRAGNLTKFGGSAYELLEDACRTSTPL